MTGLLGLIELPFPEGCAKDACTALSTGSCPIEAGEIIVYEIDLEVKKQIKTRENLPIIAEYLEQILLQKSYFGKYILSFMRNLQRN